MGILSIKANNKLNDKSVALGLGCGHELILYQLTNYCKYVMATDLYDIANKWRTSQDMLISPDHYAPVPYNPRRLGVMHMDGSHINYDDETFDIVFSYSSIEHFGNGNRTVSDMAAQEIGRVLKPGGIASISIDTCIQGNEQLACLRKKYANRMRILERYRILREMFTIDELQQFIRASGLELSNPLDFSPNINTGVVPYPDHGDEYPHYYLRPAFAPEILFGSVHLCLIKA